MPYDESTCELLPDDDVHFIDDDENGEPLPMRPVLDVDDNYAQLAERAVEVLALNDDVYVREGRLVELVDAPTAPRTVPIERDSLMFRLTREIDWVRGPRSPEYPPARARAPREVARMILAMRAWPGVRQLDGIVTGPAMITGGEVAHAPGYDAANRLYIASTTAMPAVPVAPTSDDVRAAADVLRDVFDEFEFEDASDRGAAIAFLLSCVGRRAYDGSTPLVLVDANTPGAGKGTLVAMVHAIATGDPAPMFGPPRSADETRKRITSALARGQSLLVLDNAVGVLASPEIAHAITSPIYQDRLLGKNTVFEAPMNLVIALTGNNIGVTDELARRTLRIRILSTDDRLGERAFERRDPVRWAQEHRGSILHAAFTILRASASATLPIPTLPPWNSFESWSMLVRSAVVLAGFADPIETMRRTRAESDVQTPAATTILAFMADRGTMRASDILASRREPGFEEVHAAFGLLASMLPGCARSMTTASVGRVLRGYLGRSVGGYSLSCSRPQGVTHWLSVKTHAEPEGTTTTCASESSPHQLSLPLFC